MLVSEGPVIANPVNGGGPNPLCANHAQMAPAGPENQRMVGLSLTYGNFKLASLGDLDWQRELELACPVNKLGHGDGLYDQSTRRTRQLWNAGACSARSVRK